MSGRDPAEEFGEDASVKLSLGDRLAAAWAVEDSVRYVNPAAQCELITERL